MTDTKPGRGKYIRDPERVTIVTYRNKKDNERVGVQFARSLALKIAVSDEDAIDKLIETITKKILKEEQTPAKEDDS